jgi:tRNA (guanine-N7-)-methyltransferase
MSEKTHRIVRSYVLRRGRLTAAQQYALDELWPHYGIEYSEVELDFDDHFERPAEVILEIGFGNGRSTWRMALQEPEKNFIGVEVHEPGVGHLMMSLEKHEVENVRIVCEDAVPFLQSRVAAGSLAGVRIYFPDPWPKKRHHKRRLIQPGFVDLLARCMAGGALFHLATDWQPYADHVLEVMQSRTDFVNLSPTGDYCERPEWRPYTKYEERGERLGHEVRDLLYRRT